MPTYDYLCDGCGHGFEEFQSITAKPLRKCPECNRLKLRRLIGGGAGVLFKGSGFYETDYRSESWKQGAAADRDGGSGEAGGCGTCGDPAGPGACAAGNEASKQAAAGAGKGEGTKRRRSKKGG